MVDIQPAASEIRRGIKKKIEDRKKPLGKNIMPPLHKAAIIIINDNVYGAVLMTMITARVPPFHLMNAD